MDLRDLASRARGLPDRVLNLDDVLMVDRARGAGRVGGLPTPEEWTTQRRHCERQGAFTARLDQACRSCEKTPPHVSVIVTGSVARLKYIHGFSDFDWVGFIMGADRRWPWEHLPY